MVTLNTIHNTWEEELGMEISDHTWNSASSRIDNITTCARLSLIQFKVLQHIQYSKSKLAKIYLNVDEQCEPIHIFWTCPSLKKYYWFEIFKTLSEALNVDMQPNIKMAVFVVRTDGLSINKKKKDAFASLLTRRQILLDLKWVYPPWASQWLSDPLQCLTVY